MPVTSLSIAIALFMLIYLAFHVIRLRRKLQQGIGTADEALLRTTRAHGNFCEYTPFFLIALAVAEYNATTAWLLVPLSVVFFAARIAHAYSLLHDEPVHGSYRFRFYGMVITFGCLGVMALLLIISTLT